MLERWDRKARLSGPSVLNFYARSLAQTNDDSTSFLSKSPLMLCAKNLGIVRGLEESGLKTSNVATLKSIGVVD